MKLLMWREILMKLMIKCKLMFICLVNINIFIMNISNSTVIFVGKSYEKGESFLFEFFVFFLNFLEIVGRKLMI